MMKETVDVYVLDTSAFLSFIEDEAGADEVEKLLEQSNTPFHLNLWVESMAGK